VNARAATAVPSLARAIVAVDFAEPSQSAAEWAARYLIGVKLTFVHVVDIPEPPSFVGRSIPGTAQLRENARRGAEERLEEFCHAIGARASAREVRTGSPALELTAAAIEQQADLIVVGNHGRRTGAKRYLGSTADRVLRTAHVPVLLVRPPADRAPRTVLCAIDDSALAQSVLAWTSVLARRFKAAATLVHAIEPTVSGAVRMGTVSRDSDQALSVLQRDAERWLHERAAPLKAAHIPVSTRAVFGDSGAAVIAEARRAGADIIVLARRGAGRAARLLLGSTSHRVVRQSDRTVLLIPEPE
jgi:nucleotide-binding universal stress UspA family protein